MARRTASTRSRATRPSAREAWLLPYLDLQSNYDRKVGALLRTTAEDAAKVAQSIADKPGIGAAVKRAQLTGTRGAVSAALSTMYFQLGRITLSGQQEAASLAATTSFDWDEVLLRNAIPDAKKRKAIRLSLEESSRFGLEAMLKRQYSDRIPLSRQVYKTKQLSSGWVDRRVAAGIGRGASAREIAQIVRSSIQPGTPGGVSYAAMRLARTEINNAYHGMAMDAVSDKPWVDQVKWNLSKSHPQGQQCRCEVYARKGNFSVYEIPRKPHPHCLCFITPILPTVAQFMSGMRAGKYDSYLQKYSAAA